MNDEAVARSDDNYGSNDQTEDDRTVLDSLSEHDEPPVTDAPPNNPTEQHRVLAGEVQLSG